MTRDVHTVAQDDPLADAVAVLVGRRIGAVPVVDDDGRLTGIVSYVDLLRQLQPGRAAAAA
jgi:CBS domain-containing protein